MASEYRGYKEKMYSKGKGGTLLIRDSWIYEKLSNITGKQQMPDWDVVVNHY